MPVQNVTENLDWSEDWTAWLAGDLISASAWIFPTGLSKGPDGYTNTTTTVFVPAGSTPGKYRARNVITTLAGRTGVRTRKFRIRDI